MDGEKQRAAMADDLGLDFSSLFSADTSAQTGRETSGETGAREYRNTSEEKSPAEGSSEALRGQQAKGLYVERQRELSLEQRMSEVCREYQANIKASDSLQADILKGLKVGEDPLRLLLQATEAISLMTGNRQFFRQVSDDVREIYGNGFGCTVPLKDELEMTRQRLGRLLEAQHREPFQGEGWNVAAAIKAHRRKIEELENRLAAARE